MGYVVNLQLNPYKILFRASEQDEMGFMALYTVTATHEHCRISHHLKAYLVLTTIFSPCEQLHLHTQRSSNPSLLLSAPFTWIASSPFLMDNWLKTDLDPLELDQSGYPWLLNPVFANSPPLCSGKLRPPSVLGHSANVKSRAKPGTEQDTGHESDGENVINLFP